MDCVESGAVLGLGVVGVVSSPFRVAVSDARSVSTPGRTWCVMPLAERCEELQMSLATGGASENGAMRVKEGRARAEGPAN